MTKRTIRKIQKEIEEIQNKIKVIDELTEPLYDKVISLEDEIDDLKPDKEYNIEYNKRHEYKLQKIKYKSKLTDIEEVIIDFLKYKDIILNGYIKIKRKNKKHFRYFEVVPIEDYCQLIDNESVSIYEIDENTFKIGTE